ncbi:hypothetical protein B0T12DRAFT_108811 [Alternaria alternata]|nr:hypothetical protein B0T12DRAFT_108811 [Alternaria alternata]
MQGLQLCRSHACRAITKPGTRPSGYPVRSATTLPVPKAGARHFGFCTPPSSTQSPRSLYQAISS